MPDPDHPNVPGDYRPPLTFPIPPAAPVVPCRSCKAPIVWIRTALGKRMPVNYERVDGRAPGAGTSHFVTCPHANQWRKKT